MPTKKTEVLPQPDEITELPKAEKALVDIPTKPDGVEKTLTGILGWVQKQKAKAADPKVKGTSTSRPWGWVVGLVVAVLVFLALAFLAWGAWRKGREIAKLKHELDKKKEAERKKSVNAVIAQADARKAQLVKDAKDLQVSILTIKDKIADLEEERVSDHKAIRSITKWEDVDKIFDEGN